MILNLSSRTDILAFYTPWLMNRLQAGFVQVRNPYHPQQVSQYELTPEAVDCLVFCTKNPLPLLQYPELLARLQQFETYFFVTITPYGADVEPMVPDWRRVVQATAQLAEAVGRKRVAWRYDPILLSNKYTVAYHQQIFPQMLKQIAPSVHRCVISFLDRYEKTRRNAPDLFPPDAEQRNRLAQTIGTAAQQYQLPVSTCAEDMDLQQFGISQEGCLSPVFLAQATDMEWSMNNSKPLRSNCHCLPSRDIGAYNSCPHGCRYCYANYDKQAVAANVRRHNPQSPFLLGGAQPEDDVHLAQVKRNKVQQLRLDF